MNELLFFILFISSSVFFILENAFKSFSKISLAGYMHDLKNERIKTFDCVKNYDLLAYAFGLFSFLLILIFYIFSVIYAGKWVPHFFWRTLIVTAAFFVYFTVVLYQFAFFQKERILNKIIYLYRIPWSLFYPIIMFFSKLTHRHQTDKNDDSADLTSRELEIFIEESTREGVIEKEDKEMIESVIEFGDTLVKEIMTPRVDLIYIQKNIQLPDLIKLIDEKKKSRYPVISGRIDHIEGVILSKDVFAYWQQTDFNIQDIMRQPMFVPETMRIMELLKELQHSKQKFAIVVDEFGGVSGVVTMEDIIEEIVGEIQDEYDEDEEQIVQKDDCFIVKGDTEVFELENLLQIELDEDEDFQTVSGLISYKLGKLPVIHDRITIHNYVFEVVDVEKNRIKEIKIYSK
jgi:CBS domain containing-hemolysin-like protein